MASPGWLVKLKLINMTLAWRKTDWLVDGLIPLGHVSIVAALPGAGKTTVLGALGWTVSASEPTTFLDRAVTNGAVIYVNCDSPTGDGRSVRYILEPLKVADPSGRMEQIQILEPDEGSYGLNDENMEEVKCRALEAGARLIVFDSFMACFPAINANRLQDAMGPMTALHNLATATGAAVVVIDHLPKPASGEKPGARGVMGSIGKMAQARAVHILDAVDPEEANGKHVIRWRVTKMTFGPIPKPMAVEFMHVDGGLVLAVGSIDEVMKETRTARAQVVLSDALHSAGEDWTPRKTLLALAQSTCNLGPTAAKGALDTLLGSLGPAVEQYTLPKPGSPVEYRLTRGPD